MTPYWLTDADYVTLRSVLRPENIVAHYASGVKALLDDAQLDLLAARRAEAVAAERRFYEELARA